MNAPAAITSREQRHHRLHPPLHPSASWMVPVVLGILIGGWAIFIDHNQGSSIPAAFILGIVAAIVFGAVCYGIGTIQSKLLPELRAALYGGVFGCAIGFLYNISGASNYRSSGLGLGVGLAMAVAAFYVFHAHDD
ncbi:hypothetical protein [Streptomyces cucumeris]|uniref:hypothetical protein n=1 Tax=Streptomyces TaxID=1883 RepID=UPI0020C8FEA4|nr:hypothetical protein [Streptomyces sp. NEAU-Y11]MCP9208586.1 hypothetical protein [Streptomyces sp. NEAU-Y11]